MCLLSESVDPLNNVIVNKGTELFILAPHPVCYQGKDIKEEFCIDHIAPSIRLKILLGSILTFWHSFY